MSRFAILGVFVFCVFAIGSVVTVRAARVQSIAHQSYLPIIEKPEATPTPTATPTLIPTPTATATPIPTADVKIITIVYNPSGSDAVGEHVILRNDGDGPAQMNDWRLSDEVDTTFIFPNFTLGVGQTVTIWVRSGGDNSTNLYWGRDAATWNNSGDTAFLRNSAGQLVDTCGYAGGGQSHNC